MTAPLETPSPVPLTSRCPCGRDREFGSCCAPIIAGTEAAPDAEALMRSRYTAHVVRDADYLDRTYRPTMKQPPRDGGLPAMEWVKLEVHRHEANVRPGVSHVEFTAHFIEEGRTGIVQEKSEFEWIDGAWIYTRTLRQGPPPVVSAVKVGRNDPCPCGSGKKYKKCCG